MKARATVKAASFTELVLSCDGASFGFSAGDDVSVDVKRWSSSRSLGQNAIWHKLLTMIAQKTGNDVETVKEYIKQEYGLKVQFRDQWLSKPSHTYEKNEWACIMEPTIALAIDYGVDTSWL